MGSIPSEPPHIVCIPFPAQGHVNPFMNLAKLLHSRGFHITMVYTEFNHSRLLRSKGPEAVKNSPGFRFETIPDGVPPSNPDATQSVTELLYYTKKHSVVPLRDLIVKLNSTEGLPKVSCIISDGIMSFAIKVARELGIPEVQFWTASTCGLVAYLQFGELVKKGIFPLKDEKDVRNGHLEDTALEWIPGMEHMRLKDMPSFVRSTDPEDIAFNRWLEEAQDILTADAIVFNTFFEFEAEVLETVSSMFPNIYNLGPLTTLNTNLIKNEVNATRPSLWKENTDCLTWLDTQKPNSVIYLNFGSIAVMTEDNFKEFAWGLANSGHPFLWIVRPDVVKGTNGTALPEEFLAETRDRGTIARWCPQDKVLAHPSVGAFLTHSGWNSTLEGICGGVPMLCWPFFAEQQVNCRYASTTWGVGLEIDSDVKREGVEALVREMMEGENGKVMRNKAVEWKKKSEIACVEGGSSYDDFERFVGYLLELSTFQA
ncbi:7-deoxyloganetin glucosyltransferase [Prunus yedoensis var. nudiflora]|uniref:Glycosyltransferase n=1 Tax=Prunus yedoensis var. nudiflora TaxID=2094558 RepID=A0A314Y235_PRUYE|nr:7-deoxyloganetin glucosyltransferase [Prunus yedoensis var. nudiflora]